MFRKQAAKHKQSTDHISWRGHEITRIEAFSDAVFAFAVTLLIMSLEVPHDYEEMIHGFRMAIPFGISFGIMMVIWYQQNIFFRRFGLHDFVTIILNGVLMFFVLIYMFPLKFLFGSMLNKAAFHVRPEQFANVFCLYALGYTMFNVLFFLMYINAKNKRERIGLTDGEAFAAMTSAYIYLIIAGSAFLVLLVTLIAPRTAGPNAALFALIGPATSILTKKREKIYQQRFGSAETTMKVGHTISKELSEVPDDEVN